MADTLREKIIQSLVATLTAYSAFDVIASPTISRGKELFDPDIDFFPVIAVLPGLDEAERSYGITHCTMIIDITCLIKIGGSNPSTLGEAVLGELIKATMSSLPANADDVEYTGGGIETYPDEFGELSVLSVGITIKVMYQTDIGDPYTLTT